MPLNSIWSKSVCLHVYVCADISVALCGGPCRQRVKQPVKLGGGLLSLSVRSISTSFKLYYDRSV